MTRRNPRQGSRYWGLIRRQGEAVLETEPSEPPPAPAKWPCQALRCEWKGETTECPEHGIAAYYRRMAEEGRRCYREHGPGCDRGCGDSGD